MARTRQDDLTWCYEMAVATFEARLRAMALAFVHKHRRIPAVLQLETDLMWIATCDPGIYRKDAEVDPGAWSAAAEADREWRSLVPFEPDEALVVVAPVGDEMHVRLDRATAADRAGIRARLAVALDEEPPPTGN